MQADFVRNLGSVLAAGEPLAECWISSAYTTVQGARSLRNLIGVSRKSHAILGFNMYTEAKALERLQEWGVDVQVKFDPNPGIFHPKCLYGEGVNGQAWVLAGSANLTAGGVSKNIEAGIKVTGPATLPVMRDARKFFDNLAESSAPLTAHLLDQYKAVRDEMRAALRQVSAAAMDQVLEPESSQALLLTPGGRSLVNDWNVGWFHNYIRITPMTASYKMVILALLLQAPEGRLAMVELARMFSGFYRLLALGGFEPERYPMTMRRVDGLGLKKVMDTLKDEPRKALSRPGIVVFEGDRVEISRQIWEAMTPAQRDESRGRAVERLVGYYQQYLGVATDFSSLLFGAEGAPLVQ